MYGDDDEHEDAGAGRWWLRGLLLSPRLPLPFSCDETTAEGETSTATDIPFPSPSPPPSSSTPIDEVAKAAGWWWRRGAAAAGEEEAEEACCVVARRTMAVSRTVPAGGRLHGSGSIICVRRACSRGEMVGICFFGGGGGCCVCCVVVC